MKNFFKTIINYFCPKPDEDDYEEDLENKQIAAALKEKLKDTFEDDVKVETTNGVNVYYDACEKTLFDFCDAFLTEEWIHDIAEDETNNKFLESQQYKGYYITPIGIARQELWMKKYCYTTFIKSKFFNLLDITLLVKTIDDVDIINKKFNNLNKLKHREYIRDSLRYAIITFKRSLMLLYDNTYEYMLDIETLSKTIDEYEKTAENIQN